MIDLRENEADVSNLKLKNTVGFDIEQTGAGYDYDGPIEIGFVPFDQNKSNSKYIMNCRLNFGIFPIPVVPVNVIRKSYNDIQNAPYSSYQGIMRTNYYINAYLKGKTIAGHNLHQFDIGRLNQYNYSNLLKPWPLSKTNENHIFDTTYLVKAYCAFNNDIQFIDEEGIHRYKLEIVSKYFKGQSYLQDHGVLKDIEDVKDVILNIGDHDKEFINLIYNQFYLEERLNVLKSSPIIAKTIYSKNSGADLTLHIPLFDHKWKGYYSILSIKENDPLEQTEDFLYEKFRDVKRVKRIKLNQFDIFFDHHSFAFKQRFPNWPIGKIKSIADRLRVNEDFKKEINEYTTNPTTKKNRYNNFVGCYYPTSGYYSRHDELMCERFHNSPPEVKNQLITTFQDEGLRYNAEIIMFNDFFSFLKPSVRDEIFERERDKFIKGDPSRVSLEDCKNSFEILKSSSLDPIQQQILESYENTINNFVDSPEKFHGGYNEN